MKREPLNALDETGDDFALLVAEFVEDGKLFRFTDFLDDHLLCSLGGNASEVVLRLKREDDFRTKTGVLADAARILDEDVLFRIKARELAFRGFLVVAVRVVLDFRFAFFGEAHHRLINDRFDLLEGDGAGIHIEYGAYDLSALSVLFLVRSRHGAFDSVYHGLFRDAALFEFSEH
jgi:hypothetical protein